MFQIIHLIKNIGFNMQNVCEMKSYLMQNILILSLTAIMTTVKLVDLVTKQFSQDANPGWL